MWHFDAWKQNYTDVCTTNPNYVLLLSNAIINCIIDKSVLVVFLPYFHSFNLLIYHFYWQQIYFSYFRP